MVDLSGKPQLSQGPVHKPDGDHGPIQKLNVPHKPDAPHMSEASIHKYERLQKGHNVQGAGGYEEDLKLILRSSDGSHEIAELNRRLDQYKIPRYNLGSVNEIAGDILHARFNPGIIKDNLATEHEQHSALEHTKEVNALKKLREQEGYRAAKKHEILSHFFDYLKEKKK